MQVQVQMRRIPQAKMEWCWSLQVEGRACLVLQKKKQKSTLLLGGRGLLVLVGWLACWQLEGGKNPWDVNSCLVRLKCGKVQGSPQDWVGAGALQG